MLASRLLSILLTLQSKGRATAGELAAAFEVSVRTIYRDIDELSAAGVPVYAEQGRHGGFRLLDGYRTRLTGLDRGEAEALFLAGLPGAAAQLGLGEARARMRLKLLAALPDAARADAERIAARFHLDPVAWFQAPDEQAILPELATAVWERRTARIVYDSWNGVVTREIAPLGVVLKAGTWYAVARVGEAVRTYRVAGIQSFELGPPVADPSGGPAEGFDLAAHWAAFARDYEARIYTAAARLRANPEALWLLSRINARLAQAVEGAGPPDAEGWRELTIPIESIGQATATVLRLGARAEVLDPPELRASIARVVEGLAAIYGRPPLSASGSA
jgi:predicted DNA-binding transcriptional regulator YafY